MPAVTADTLTLPRLNDPDPATSTDRSVQTVTTANETLVFALPREIRPARSARG